MVSESPISRGFRTAFREPAIVLAEIAWRWSFGLAVLALAAGSLFAYLATLRVSRFELMALRGHPRLLIADAIGHMLHGGPRLVMAAAIVLPAIFVLWIAAATVGRAATLKALLRREGRVALSPQLGLNFLRASVTLAALIGYLGAAILAGRAAAGRGRCSPGRFLVGVCRARCGCCHRALARQLVSLPGSDSRRARRMRHLHRHQRSCWPFSPSSREICRRRRRFRHHPWRALRVLHRGLPAGPVPC